MDDTKRYLVKELLWSIGRGRYVVPGEVMEYTDAQAAPLLEKQAIELIEQEIEDDTDSECN